jgi:predicted dehydrogenase
MVLEAAQAGKHVLCEKPISLRQEDGEAIIQACQKAGVRFFVCMVVRFFPRHPDKPLDSVPKGQEPSARVF